MTTILNNPNTSFSNASAMVDTFEIVDARSDNNSVTNTGVMWTTGINKSAVYFDNTSSNGTVNNSGYIRGERAALYFESDGGTIGNSGEMIGGAYGAVIDPNANEAVNFTNVFGGTIKGGATGIVFWPDQSSQLNNDGIIFGGDAGVALRAKLINSGEIGGGATGILAEGNSTITNTTFGGIWSSGNGVVVQNGTVDITNDSNSQIAGAQAAIVTQDGLTTQTSRIFLINSGTIDGQIDCNAIIGTVNDGVINSGTIKGAVNLGAGNDEFESRGGTSGKVSGEDGNDTLIGGSANDVLDGGAGKDKLDGGKGNDTLYGQTGNDTLLGGDGNDWLNGSADKDILTGGAGRDVLFGGSGADRFDFNSIKDSKKGSSRDQIKDFSHGQGDRIDLRDIDANTKKSGNQNFKFIGDDKFSKKAGELRFDDKKIQADVNGDGKGDFEIYVNVNKLVSDDFIL